MRPRARSRCRAWIAPVWFAPVLLVAVRADAQAAAGRLALRDAGRARRDACATVSPSPISGINPRDTYVRMETSEEREYNTALDSLIPDPITGRPTKLLHANGAPTHDALEAGYDTAGVVRFASTSWSRDDRRGTVVSGPYDQTMYDSAGRATGPTSYGANFLTAIGLDTTTDVVEGLLASSAARPRALVGVASETVSRTGGGTRLVTRFPDGGRQTEYFRRGPDGVERLSAVETRGRPLPGAPGTNSSVTRMRVVRLVICRAPARDSARAAQRAASYPSP